MASWKIINESISSIDRDKKIYILECKKCKQLNEVIVTDAEELKKIKCSNCGAVGGEPEKKVRESHSQLKVDDNLRYRLKYTWIRLQKEGKLAAEWDSSFENFRDWSIQNGYAYYKVLERKNKNIKFRPSNCFWVVNRSIFKLDKIEDTTAFKSKVYSNVLTRTNNIQEMIDELDKEVEILRSLSGISEIEGEKIRRKLDKLKKDLKDIRQIEDTIWPDKDKVEWRGTI